MATETDKSWSNSWVGWFWKAWSSVVAFTVFLTGALFGLVERKTLAPSAWQALYEEHSWPLWWFVLAILATAIIVSGGFIALTQLWDKRRIEEADRKIDTLRDRKDKSERQLKEKSIELENLQGIFRDRERMRMLDHITGVPNFESWEEDLSKWASKGRNENQFSLILIDLDKLKWLNERSRDCADFVLRYFARNTYESMRRNEQLYKAPEKLAEAADGVGLSQGGEPSTTSKMYRHYQGGDEFFFIIGGNIFEAIGFANRLAESIKSYERDIRDQILTQFMSKEDSEEFHLSFSEVIEPIRPGTSPQTALSNAYRILDRAKKSASRLLVVFEGTYEHLAIHRAKLERERDEIQAELKAASEKHGKSAEIAERLDILRNEERNLDKTIVILKKGEQLFSVKSRGS